MVGVGVGWMSIEMGEGENSGYVEVPQVASGSYCGRLVVGSALCSGEHGLVSIGFCRNKEGGGRGRLCWKTVGGWVDGNGS